MHQTNSKNDSPEHRKNGVMHHMIPACGAKTAANIWQKLGGAMTGAYWRTTDDIDICQDLLTLNKIYGDGTQLHLRIAQSDGAIAPLRIHIYHRGTLVPLSDTIPIFERMGLRVIAEEPCSVSPDNDDKFYIHMYYLETESGTVPDLDVVGDNVRQAFFDVYNKQAENDPLNRLVIEAGLTPRQVVILRSYACYLHQVKAPFAKASIADALAKHPRATNMLISLFETRFNPDFKDDRNSEYETIWDNIRTYLDEVPSLQHDSIIRRYGNAIANTLRTNFYQLNDDGTCKERVALKIASRDIMEIPKPAPLREIFVYSPRFEAVHLRFGFVARGGLRWSDRRADFRTEIMGLVKAQQVKNSVIVPVGSKGGFVLKQAEAISREALMKEGIICYQQFIRSLLDITDNLDGVRTIPPQSVVCHDDPDPYLVVAADKGTATFSDFANQESVGAGFWLGDAFASGGSNGYDHKKMGITARGGWESVKRHFREMGIDTQSQDFSVIGVGDMSGDVFGNGMILSPHIALKAAFNHLNIYVDPNPTNLEAHHAERKRLFDMPRSSWTDFNIKLLSKGGGIFDRSAKSITITPEMKQAFDIADDTLTPNQLIKEILKSQVDLLWFGGIGTYIKGSIESHNDVGDPNNDDIRITAKECRAKVLGEGANLGVTPLARIEYAQRGGRCNSDAIDNSAGVDCSDHEVNIKILLSAVQQKTGLSDDDRNALLESMTDEVAELVLRDNYEQTQCITTIKNLGVFGLSRQRELMRHMENIGELDRPLEYLPSDDEINERFRRREGLTRPEIAVLLAYAKNITYHNILDSDVPDDPSLHSWLVNYFPTAVRKPYVQEIVDHRLRREIVATVVTNDMINRTRVSFMNDMYSRTGAADGDIARAYLITRGVFNLPRVWQQIESLDNKISTDMQNQLLEQTVRLIERMTEWFLRYEPQLNDIRGCVQRYRAGIEIMSDKIESLLGPTMRADLHQRRERYSHDAIPQNLTETIAVMKVISAVADIVRLATVHDTTVSETAKTYYACGQRFFLGWLRHRANRISGNSPWENLAISSSIDDLWALQSAVAHWIMRDANGNIDQFLTQSQGTVNRIDKLLDEIRASETFDLSMLIVVSREIRSLVS